jgi:hypothetical protein
MACRELLLCLSMFRSFLNILLQVNNTFPVSSKVLAESGGELKVKEEIGVFLQWLKRLSGLNRQPNI